MLNVNEMLAVKILNAMNAKKLFLEGARMQAEAIGQTDATHIILEEMETAWPLFHNKMVQVYAKHHTTEELKHLLEFLSTPLGKDILLKQGTITNLIMQETDDICKTVFERAFERL